jgi:hypothetical protein
MSHEERYGTMVWNALSEVFNAPDTPDDGWITVGQVADKAQIAKPTAAKYLNKLVILGEAKRVCVGAGKSLVVGYRPNWAA